MIEPTIRWKTVWSNGVPTYFVAFSHMSTVKIAEVEKLAAHEGYLVDKSCWKPTEVASLHRLIASLNSTGVQVEFENDDENRVFDTQRLKLEPHTRQELENLSGFVLSDLAGYCPVQAEGELHGQEFYFRARELRWRLDVYGDNTGTKAPSWWYGEDWPGETGFEAGYMSDEDAIRCILKAVNIFRTEDKGRFKNGHKDYEWTVLFGWSIGSLTLRDAMARLKVSSFDALGRAKQLGIELPYLAETEAAQLARDKSVDVADLNAEGGLGEWGNAD